MGASGTTDRSTQWGHGARIKSALLPQARARLDAGLAGRETQNSYANTPYPV